MFYSVIGSTSCTSMQGIFLFSLVRYKRITYEGVEYPPWSEAVGWLIALASMSLVPAVATYKVIVADGTLRQVSGCYADYFNFILWNKGRQHQQQCICVALRLAIRLNRPFPNYHAVTAGYNDYRVVFAVLASIWCQILILMGNELFTTLCMISPVFIQIQHHVGANPVVTVISRNWSIRSTDKV